MHLLNSRQLPRRSFLTAAGVSVALPLLEAMLPGGARAWAATPQPPKRMLLIGRSLGMHTPYLFPAKAGKDYEAPPYLKLLAEHRNDMTVISGMSHPGYAAGHGAEIALFTGTPYENISNPRFIRNTVSVDQVAVEIVGDATRVPCITTHLSSTSRTGTSLPGDGVEAAFNKFFTEGKPDEVAKVVRGLEDGRSIMDHVREQAKSLQKRLGAADRGRLDQYFNSIRDAEIQLERERNWIHKPKPPVDSEAFRKLADTYLLETTRSWYEVAALAFQTDSTRIMTLFLFSGGPVMLHGKLTPNHHDLSHHGQEEKKIEQLAAIETEEIKLWGGLLSKLKAVQENEGTLLDNTMVFMSSNLSNANSHSNQNLPNLLAGGGFKHGRHLAFDQQNNRPLCDLYVTMLQRFGVETDRFGTSSGTLSELV